MSMRERKYVKFRVDMYDGTKFKIIDRRPERDLIHYVWNRVVVLAEKVNLEGELYLSKNIPYTVETLAIEFNRDIKAVKLALDVLIQLEMIELTEHNIYIVKNFSKHQNIKAKGKNKTEDKEFNISKAEVQVNEKLKDEINPKEISKADVNIDNKNTTSYPQDNIPILFETEKSKKVGKSKKEDNSIEAIDDNSIFCITEWEIPLGNGEQIISKWAFGG